MKIKSEVGVEYGKDKTNEVKDEKMEDLKEEKGKK